MSKPILQDLDVTTCRMFWEKIKSERWLRVQVVCDANDSIVLPYIYKDFKFINI